MSIILYHYTTSNMLGVIATNCKYKNENTYCMKLIKRIKVVIIFPILFRTMKKSFKLFVTVCNFVSKVF